MRFIHRNGFWKARLAFLHKESTYCTKKAGTGPYSTKVTRSKITRRFRILGTEAKKKLLS